MIESITTLTPSQQVAAVQSKDAEVNRLHVHQVRQGNSEFKDSENRRNKLTEFEKLLQKNLAETNQSVSIAVDDVTKKIVVKVIDLATNEVVRQLPTEEMLRISRGVAESEMKRGNLTDVRV